MSDSGDPYGYWSGISSSSRKLASDNFLFNFSMVASKTDMVHGSGSDSIMDEGYTVGVVSLEDEPLFTYTIVKQ